MRYQLERFLSIGYFLRFYNPEQSMIVLNVSCTYLSQLTWMHCGSFSDRPLTVYRRGRLFFQSHACRSFACAWQVTEARGSDQSGHRSPYLPFTTTMIFVVTCKSLSGRTFAKSNSCSRYYWACSSGWLLHNPSWGFTRTKVFTQLLYQTNYPYWSILPRRACELYYCCRVNFW